MGIEVAAARTPEQDREVYRFRYAVYVDELGLDPPGTDHATRQVKDPLDEAATNYMLRRDGTVVGSLRVLRLAELEDPSALIAKLDLAPALEAFSANEIGTTSRFMLHPSLRHGKAILALMRAAFEDAAASGARLNFGDCSPHMLPFYEHLGYRRCGAAFNDPHFGYKLPILMLVGDLDYFTQVRAPLARVARRYPPDQEARAWFERCYPEHIQPSSASLLPEGVFLDLLAERIGESPIHHLSLLKDLTEEEAKRFLSEAAVIRAQPGDRLIRQGERDDTLYAMLSGLAEVFVDDAESRPINQIAAGDTFGEIGLVAGIPRSASVVARAPCELLVLSADALKRLQRTEPAIAVKVAFNLARDLAVRLAIRPRGG